ncbi:MULTISPECIES: DNA topoisomerase IV subunit A [unclassified Lactococcus]|uniref:DNA topoisomerase IV subunit A n=1 Tax=unclassified Lactococcus TaxID=2643510 RepID=UPI0011C9179C|nr:MULTISPECIES: DNA topoisomerase IV subunit A [unclassified Lactococcus]MQW23797.1 DNA topoisomerase IV subunit A [Lactococcus sp. dk101]TXK37379.1 DNA topoisomerase IV subunit A [Lactococcus sp. dk310]TXK48690.1 DNA topoisomerase IV subunit A [Lactococcus sp. dk322]
MSNIQKLPLEDIMGDRFGRYSKYIIQERALPDIRDGLKPVQRRILYSMNKDGNTFEKAYRKSAKSVGNVMGNFHPHGDSSIYEAMIRLSQDWKMGEPLIEMHGNNGSMDGDSPAAMRYTEARLAEIAGYMLSDIEKETVSTAWNFDDTEKEPTVLPASFPNLLVNGSTGISAGYATDIPTHNLGEVIDATIYMIDHEDASLEKIMEFLPGPDFPTGAIIQGKEEIKKAYQTGKGRVVVRSRVSVESMKGGRQQLIVTEIPYEINKANMVKKIDDVRVNAKVPGISEVRDESDREGLRIAIELKKEADSQLVLNYLYKNTDLQVNYNFNMVAIDKMMPRQVGVLPILKGYIKHREDVIVKRSKFDLAKAEKRLHIVVGLIRMVSILDEVVATIRASENKSDAKDNIKVSFGFTEEQAEAIVTLQLYRLTNTDIVTLENERDGLNEQILELKAVINDEKTLFNVMKRELRDVKKKFGRPRRTELQADVETIEIEAHELILEEETVVSVTKAGYIKRTSPRSFASSNLEEIGKRDDDELLFYQTAKTTQHLLIFTTLGNAIYRPIHELTDARWKDLGEHLSQSLNNFASNEEILAVKIVDDFKDENLLVVTKKGQIKQVELASFSPWRTYRSKSTVFMKIKGDDDAVIMIEPVQFNDLMLISQHGYALRFNLDDVPVLGAKAAGVKAINLKDGDLVTAAFFVSSNSWYLLTQRGFIKRVATADIPATSRANRGLQVLRTLKNNNHTVFAAGLVHQTTADLSALTETVDLFTEPVVEETSDHQILSVLTTADEQIDVDLMSLSLSERTSNGHPISDTIEQVASAQLI